DWGVISDPYTGLSLGKLVQKAELTAQEDLPNRQTNDWVTLEFVQDIPVPEDAWADWDAVNQKFITVGEKFPVGMTSKTKSVVYYTPELWNTTWHDGSKMDVADFVMNMILSFDPGKKDSPIYDESLVPSLETFLTHFKGVRIVSTDPHALEVGQESVEAWHQ